MAVRSIPLELQELTATWFTSVLSAEVHTATIEDAHSGTTGRARVRLVGDPTLPETVFVKLAPFDVGQRSFVDEHGMGVAEARFYAEIAAEVPVMKPRALHAAWDDDGRYVMVFDDFTRAGGAAIAADHPEMLAIVDGIIDNFAALHAAFHDDVRFETGGSLEWVARRSRGYGAGGGPFVRMAMDSLGGQLGAEFVAFAEFYCQRANEIAEVIGQGTPTLVHGDAHLANMYVVDTAPGFYDWAVIGAAPGMRDVAYFLANSVTTEARREHEHRWIDRWCAALAAHGIEIAANDAWEQYRRQAIAGWVAAVATAGVGSKWQPIEVAVRATHRAIAAVADLGTRDAMREAGIG